MPHVKPRDRRHERPLPRTPDGGRRVLIFNSSPTTSEQPADVVLGQGSFTEGSRNRCGCDTAAADTLHAPHFMFWDGCRLFVADSDNNRVLIY